MSGTPNRLAKVADATWLVLDDTDAFGVLPPGTTLGSLLAMDAESRGRLLAGVPRTPGDLPPLLAPLDDDTEVWAAGVTYEVSREARMAESTEATIYAKVYGATRPELFFKAVGWRVAGPGRPIGVREDSTWDVPEPELAVVCDAGGAIAAYTIANDVSSRSIEGENPLYLPQAKVFRGSCALGPWLRLADTVPDPYRLAIGVRIDRDGATRWSGQTSTARLHRKLDELVAYLYRADVFPRGAVLATGTSAVPGDDVTLQQGDEVTIDVAGIGSLTNPVLRGVRAFD
jgi:2-dehydro-3-deoxy-D-arabinonate dehydratase